MFQMKRYCLGSLESVESLLTTLGIFSSRGGNVTLHIRARYQYEYVTYTGYEIATHYAISIRIFTLVYLKP